MRQRPPAGDSGSHSSKGCEGSSSSAGLLAGGWSQDWQAEPRPRLGVETAALGAPPGHSTSSSPRGLRVSGMLSMEDVVSLTVAVPSFTT